MAPLTCPACRTINHEGSIVCFRCGAALPTPDGVTNSPAGGETGTPMEVLPAEPGAWPVATAAQTDRRMRPRYRFALVAALVLALALGVNWWISRRTMPDTLLGLPRMHSTYAAVGALDGYEPPLNFISAAYGTGQLPELTVAAGSSSATIHGPTPGDYLLRLQAEDPPAGLAIDPTFGIRDVREVQQGEDRYACGLIREVPNTFANQEGLMCYWTSGVHRLGEIAWFPSQPVGDALVTAGLKATAVIAHATD